MAEEKNYEKAFELSLRDESKQNISKPRTFKESEEINNKDWFIQKSLDEIKKLKMLIAVEKNKIEHWLIKKRKIQEKINSKYIKNNSLKR